MYYNFYALIDGRSYIIHDRLSHFRSGWKKDQVQLCKSNWKCDFSSTVVPGDQLIPSTVKDFTSRGQALFKAVGMRILPMQSKWKLTTIYFYYFLVSDKHIDFKFLFSCSCFLASWQCLGWCWLRLFICTSRVKSWDSSVAFYTVRAICVHCQRNRLWSCLGTIILSMILFAERQTQQTAYGELSKYYSRLVCPNQSSVTECL